MLSDERNTSKKKENLRNDLVHLLVLGKNEDATDGQNHKRKNVNYSNKGG